MKVTRNNLNEGIKTLNAIAPHPEGVYHLGGNISGYAIHLVYPSTARRDLLVCASAKEASAWLDGAIYIAYLLKENNEH